MTRRKKLLFYIWTGISFCTWGTGALSSALTAEPWVKVRLFADQPVRQVRLSTTRGLSLGGQTLQAPVTLSVQKDSVVLRDAQQVLMVLPQARFNAKAGQDFLLTTSAGNRRQVTGSVVVRAKAGRLVVVNTVPCELYVLGVVEPELGSLDFPPESLKAQVIASRSYVLSMRHRHERDGFNFCDTQHCQVYRGTVGVKSQLLAAASAVRGQFLTFQGKAIPAFYHDSCGGSTAAAQDVWPVTPLPYLRVVRDGAAEPYCRFAPRAHWRFQISQDRLRRCLVRAGILKSQEPLYGLRVLQQDASGRVRSLAIQSRRLVRIPVRSLQWTMNRMMGDNSLPSTLFSIQFQSNHFVFEGRGWGHGVGLCQWGTIEMAREGQRYTQILSHYFPGTELRKIPTPIYASNEKEKA